ncbi:hypothetical protein GC105_00710 [Alkalibaculum sp. M08DMB]|uniref:RNA polymerase sigma factor 70 region 4 type 2 domain-containing protein n=1 Tax=Alkalibaculum sporogenes TaxID=2655001 RepID=A0A6A7K4S3_9FIRM|nr:sigma factor-like helix-turn-helix DNA-binding protein [Alkalibaculum sporogenes]MPW24314.1 hypothetical protein [Alkalibaculum sporogenes]
MRDKMLYQEIIALQTNYREVLILFYFGDLSIQSISDITNYSISNTKTLLSRARRKLKENLEGKGYEF